MDKMTEIPGETMEKEYSLQALTSEPDSNTILRRLSQPISENFSVEYYEIVFTGISMLLRPAAIIWNLLLAVEYYNLNKWNYFTWTLSYILVPMVITTLLGIHMYVSDRKKENKKICSKFLWLVVLCPFLFRYCKSLKYALISKHAERQNDYAMQKKYYKIMIEEETDIALIRIFESALEVAPQKILQISIYLAGEDKMTWLQFLTICGCFFTLTWCIVGYHKNIRTIQPDKEKISIIGIIVQIAWHFCIYVSRILSIATVASIFPLPTIIACSLHAFLIGFFIFFFERPVFCSETICHRIMFSWSIGIVFIFTYISLKDVRTRNRYAFYYILCAIENLIFIVLYFNYANAEFKQSIFFIPLCAISFLSFYVGIVFMLVYYVRLHPNVLARRDIFVSNSTT